MTTAEDVWYLYEKKNTYKDLIKHDKTTDYIDNFDTDLYESPVNPEKIGNQFNSCNFKRKVYIKPGEECPICLENIVTKSNAYLTGCGHSFHKKCLFKNYEANRKMKANCSLNCPMCRSNLGLEIKECAHRYLCYDNYLDQLENFWLRNEFMCCDICYNKKDHYIGMKKDCETCKQYINGELLFGL